MPSRRQVKKIPEMTEIVENADKWKLPILVGTPTLGQVRYEWHSAMQNTVIPMNWAGATIAVPVRVVAPLRFHVAEAQNIIVKNFIESRNKFDWLLFLEDDVVVPADIYVRLAKWAKEGRYPVVSGFYHLKSQPPEPMMFRGRGNGGFTKFKPGSVVWCDGVPTGCLLINRKLLEVCWENAPPITLRRMTADGAVAEIKTREVFITKREAGIDPESGGYYKRIGTSDLVWCDDVIKNKYLKKAGFPEAAKKKYPFPVDTAIKCGHIDLSTGVVY